jgi:hypothetical protein
MEIKLNLSSSEYKDLKSYCDLNNLEINEVVKKSYYDGFRIEKYGLLSGSDKVIEKEVIREVPIIEEKIVEVVKEVVVEKLVEVPVEVIKEVYIEKEVIKEVEVPVEVIKEVYIEKEVIKEVFISGETESTPNIVEVVKYIEREPEIIEKIVEVPVEVIKEVYIDRPTNNKDLKNKIELLQKTIQNLKNDNIEKNTKLSEYEKKLNELKDKNNKPVVFLRNSNLENRLKK